MISHAIDFDSSEGEISEESNCSEIESLSSFDKLPAVVLRRVNALMKLHSEKQIIDENYFNEVHILEKKFEESYSPLFAKRNKIVSGVFELEDWICHQMISFIAKTMRTDRKRANPVILKAFQDFGSKFSRIIKVFRN
jgi:hypothetical protein